MLAAVKSKTVRKPQSVARARMLLLVVISLTVLTREQKRVHRGGSFLCTEEYCTRYMVGTRGKGEVRSASNHLGFRTVKDSPKQ